MKLTQVRGVFLTGLLLIFFIKCSDSSKGSATLGVPVLKDAVNITANSFTAQWIGVTGATAYLLDVSKDANFNTLLSSYNKKMVSGETTEVINLDEKNTYYLRLKATNGTSESDFSGIKSFTTTAAPEIIPAQRDEPLRSKTTIPIGVALQASKLAGDYATRVKNEFSSITAEYEMKMDPIFQAVGSYNFTPGDKLVDFAKVNNMQVHGHALIWHGAVPTFVKNFSGTNQEFEDMIHTYIKDVVTHFKGKVVSWDVVNEAFEDGNTGALRNSIFRQKMGDNYVAKCFQFAREADPNVLLFYNDYNIESDKDNSNNPNIKLNAVLSMVDNLQANSIPINGVGFQMHINYNYPSEIQLTNAVAKVVAKGVKVHFSEIDIRVNPNNDLTFLTVAQANAQKAKYKEVVRVYRTTVPSAQQFAITVWGVNDGSTWLIDFWKQPEWPLLFFDDLKPKPAHTGFLEALEL
jgi:endo-1,4-beta-xylanase